MRIRKLVLFSVLVGLVALQTPVWAQDADVFARISAWDIDRAEWGAFIQYFDKNLKSVFDRQFSDGVIIEWGFNATTMHEPDGYSHGLWWTANSLENIERVLEALEASERQRNAEERAWFSKAIIKHSDFLVHSPVFKTRAVTLHSGYSGSSDFQVKLGHGRDFREWWDTYIKPVYEKLFDDGAVVSYGLDVEYLHRSHPGNRTDWFVARDAKSLDRIDDAFEEAFENRSSEEIRAINDAIRQVTDGSEHRDSLSKIIHYSSKGN